MQHVSQHDLNEIASWTEMRLLSSQDEHHDNAAEDTNDLDHDHTIHDAAIHDDTVRDDYEYETHETRDTHEAIHNDQTKRRTLLKLDCILLPFLSLLFCLNHLDKTNIGNAETAGFSHDAGLKDGDINIAMAWFFAFFVALQPLGAALGRKVGMARWVPACMSLWGLCTILHIWVSSRWQLVTLRIVIATLEAGFYPTTVSYLSLFYTRYEFAVRLGIFYGQAAVSGALGGILSWAVFSHYSHPHGAQEERDGQIKPWQVLFLIEGCVTLVVASLGFFWLPHSAGQAWFFTKSERLWAEKRILLDRDAASAAADLSSTEDMNDEAHDQLLDSDNVSASKIDPEDKSLTADSGLQRHEIVSAFLQYNIWHLLVCNILSAIPATAFGIFLPIIIKQMRPDLDLSPAASNLLAVPPFAFGAALLLAFTYWSDRTHCRLVPILLGLVILILGLSITVHISSARYAGLFILLGGSYIASPLTVAWISNNTPEPGKRAILLGINGWGNLAGVSSGFLFTPSDAADGYASSFTTTLIGVVVSLVGYSLFMLLVRRENKRRDTVVRHWSQAKKQREALYGDVEIPRSTLSFYGNAIRRGDERLIYRYTY